jgi:hypothetical protein
MVLNNFCVFGDSFAYRNDDNPHTWMALTADKFNLDLKIAAVPGSGQDYTFGQLYHFRHFITPNDRVVVVLTEPGRRWLFKDKPEYSNIYIFNYKEVLSSDECKKLESYVKYIQDDSLDNLAMINRLGWLDSLASRQRWNKPLVIKAFDMVIDEDEYPHLSFAQGCLTNVSRNEFIGNHLEVLRGYDFRYNHLCLSNHKILAAKLIDYYSRGSTVDLTTGFKSSIIADNFYRDSNFVQTELYSEAYKRWANEIL